MPKTPKNPHSMITDTYERNMLSGNRRETSPSHTIVIAGNTYKVSFNKDSLGDYTKEPYLRLWEIWDMPVDQRAQALLEGYCAFLRDMSSVRNSGEFTPHTDVKELT